jgi:hypothetical protein
MFAYSENKKISDGDIKGIHEAINQIENNYSKESKLHIILSEL